MFFQKKSFDAYFPARKPHAWRYAVFYSEHPILEGTGPYEGRKSKFFFVDIGRVIKLAPGHTFTLDMTKIHPTLGAVTFICGQSVAPRLGFVIRLVLQRPEGEFVKDKDGWVRFDD